MSWAIRSDPMRILRTISCALAGRVGQVVQGPVPRKRTALPAVPRRQSPRRERGRRVHRESVRARPESALPHLTEKRPMRRPGDVVPFEEDDESPFVGLLQGEAA